ncbi:VQ domain-containing protein [Dioscorea alata]|uniref:VQ domain-containing protein n=1 Tax=Dioscorea alata TaxID=55571 RepID=A0ACB7W2I3_DIOAL|nr:VQ domain-containing protein [Dioscorea alata]
MSAEHVQVGRKVVDLQGPRPTALLLHKESHKINKSPTTSSKKPVVIYMVSPEIIHVEPSEFMALVQRLTGPSSSSPPTHGLEPSQSQRKSGDEFPVRVKARPFMTAAERSPSQSQLSPTLFFSDLSPLSESGGGCSQRKNSLASQGWLFNGDNNMVDHSGGFLDIFNHVQQ